MHFIKPTPIQAQAIPPALEGKDILGSAQTGTGKTAAFGIPLIVRLINEPDSTALVMTPTRELASQVIKQLQMMAGKKSSIKSSLLIGGESMQRQLQQLKNKPRLIVGTPGRINDHLKRKTLKLDNAKFLVLDETDRMLDMGFTDQIELILKFMPKKKQTLLFSATIPPGIAKITQKYLYEPIRVSVDAENSVATKVKQDIVHTTESDKYEKFLSQIADREGSIIVFMRTKHSTEKMAAKLTKEGHKANAINGDLRQNKRDRVINNFRNKKYRILVATDVASRGLDIPHIEHVINYDLPECPEDYVHRIGRTGRAGAEGSALCFVTPSDKHKWNAINRLLNPNSKSNSRINRDKDSDRPARKNKKNYRADSARKPGFKFKKKKPRLFKKPKQDNSNSARTA
jgi:superfamily II DNA/RNA helicase